MKCSFLQARRRRLEETLDFGYWLSSLSRRLRCLMLLMAFSFSSATCMALSWPPCCEMLSCNKRYGGSTDAFETDSKSRDYVGLTLTFSAAVARPLRSSPPPLPRNFPQALNFFCSQLLPPPLLITTPFCFLYRFCFSSYILPYSKQQHIIRRDHSLDSVGSS